MGDKPIPFTPHQESIMDDVAGMTFASCAIRSCPHPAVIRRFGTNGVANVSVYTCHRCKYKVEHKYHGGLGCSYGVEKDVPPGEGG